MKQYLNVNNLVFLLISLSSGLMAISMFLMGGHRHIDLTLAFYGLNDWLSSDHANLIAASGFLLLAVLAGANIVKHNLRRPLFLLLTVIAAVPLLSLFSASMWIDSLGGFPIIGSGQGVIKYFALLSVALCLFLSSFRSANTGDVFSPKSLQWIAIFPVLLVLAWIGAMKFYEFEAQGIKTLLETSPFMSWMYSVWDLQTTSNLIGVFDLLTVALLVLSIYKPLFLVPGVLMALSVMLMTQTFLFTLPGALSGDTILTTTGHFLIKDLWFIANLLLYWKLSTKNERLFN